MRSSTYRTDSRSTGQALLFRQPHFQCHPSPTLHSPTPMKLGEAPVQAVILLGLLEGWPHPLGPSRSQCLECWVCSLRQDPGCHAFPCVNREFGPNPANPQVGGWRPSPVVPELPSFILRAVPGSLELRCPDVCGLRRWTSPWRPGWFGNCLQVI